MGVAEIINMPGAQESEEIAPVADGLEVSDLPEPGVGANTQELVYTRADGTIERAQSMQDAIMKCPFLGKMALQSPDKANKLLRVMALGQEKLEAEKAANATNPDSRSDFLARNDPDHTPGAPESIIKKPNAEAEHESFIPNENNTSTISTSTRPRGVWGKLEEIDDSLLVKSTYEPDEKFEDPYSIDMSGATATLGVDPVEPPIRQDTGTEVKNLHEAKPSPQPLLTDKKLPQPVRKREAELPAPKPTTAKAAVSSKVTSKPPVSRIALSTPAPLNAMPKPQVRPETVKVTKPIPLQEPEPIIINSFKQEAAISKKQIKTVEIKNEEVLLPLAEAATMEARNVIFDRYITPSQPKPEENGLEPETVEDTIPAQEQLSLYEELLNLDVVLQQDTGAKEEAGPEVPAASISEFEEEVMLEIADQRVTTQVIQEDINSQPLEDTLVQLAAVIEVTEPDAVEEIRTVLKAIQHELKNSPAFNETNGTEVLNSKATEELLVLLAKLGHDAPREALATFVSRHGMAYLTQILQYVSQLDDQDRQEILSAKAASLFYKDDQGSYRRIGQIIFALMAELKLATA